MWSRKTEVSIEQLRRQRQEYLKLSAESSRATVIDTEQSVGNMVAQAAGVITNYLADRFEQRYQHRLPFGQWSTPSGNRTVEDLRGSLAYVFGNDCSST